MKQHKSATVERGRVRPLDLEGARGSALMMIYIIDLLPWQDDAEGMTMKQIQAELGRLGVHVDDRTLQRTMKKLMKCANVEWTSGKPRRFKRFHPHRISDCLASRYALPEMESEIHFDAGLVTR